MTVNRKFFSTTRHTPGYVINGSNLRGNFIGKSKLSSEHDSEITKDGKDHRQRNLPKLKFDQHFCDACKIGKQAHASHKAKNIVSTTRCLELLHMDLFSPSAVWSYGGNRYTLVIVDDYSRTDPSREFDNEVQFGEFCNANGITHNFSAPRTPQSNGVVERKNRTLQEISRTMLNEQSLPQKFWCNAVDTSTYILNRILIRAILGKTPYELLREPKNVNEALTDDSWIVAMQEELYQFIANDVWELVPQPRNMKITGTKWVFRNKLDDNGNVSRNKARLVAQGYNQQEGIDYDETYAPVTRLESIRILLAFACALDFKLFQMDVKSAFLNGFINEEVYVAQPPGFIDFEKPDHVYKLKKALYGLKKHPKLGLAVLGPSVWSSHADDFDLGTLTCPFLPVLGRFSLVALLFGFPFLGRSSILLK
ncbi:retrovirus-related pol polyprotein from transposon TNT 1-94 [Tanacetum coccineum]